MIKFYIPYNSDNPMLMCDDDDLALGWDGEGWQQLADGRTILKNADFTVLDGKFDKSFVTKDRRGRVALVCNFSKGKLHGILCQYRRGKIRYLQEYNQGKKCGLHCVWHDDGSMAI